MRPEGCSLALWAALGLSACGEDCAYGPCLKTDDTADWLDVCLTDTDSPPDTDETGCDSGDCDSAADSAADSSTHPGETGETGGDAEATAGRRGASPFERAAAVERLAPDLPVDVLRRLRAR